MHKDYISEIRKSIENGSMNFLVGAGFSRNISKEFPTWKDLLGSMVEQMYAISLPPDSQAKKRKIEEIISEKGYLGTASEYVRRKGYHVAIDLFIEQNTPYLKKKEDSSFELVKDGVVLKDTPDMRCHKALISLGASNIFTFNYDNALDIAGQTDDTLAKHKRISEIEKELKRLKEEFEYNLEQKYLNEQESESGTITPEIITHKGRSYKSTKGFGYNINIDEKIHSLEMELTYLQSLTCENYQLIKNSYEISLTEQKKNIYKLHGSLRLKGENNDFGFDGDRHKQYIITTEDYEEYPQKHEAFVNLMKISLLKGSFCIIGFSGDDPNFLMWIKWVKDVLDKNPEEGKRAPIYFIYPEDAPLPDEKYTLFKTHYIEPVVLKDIYSGNIKDKILSFFENITPSSIDTIQYDKLWNSLKLGYEIKPLSETQILTIEKLYKLYPSLRIASQKIRPSHSRDLALLYIRRQLSSRENLEPQLAKLALMAAEGELKLLHNCFTSDQIHILETLIHKDDIQLLNFYNSHKGMYYAVKWDGKKVQDFNFLNEESAYNAVLAQMFHLNFRKTRELLAKWNPISVFNKARKEILLSMIGTRHESSLETLLHFDEYDSIQDYRYMLRLLPHLYKVWQSKGGLNDRVEKLKQRYLDNCEDNDTEYYNILQKLLDKLLKPDKIHSYGNQPIEYKMDTYDSLSTISLQIVHLMIKLAYPTHTPGIILISKEKWYIVFSKVVEHYPFAALYFSLLMGSDKEFIQKISQEIIYSPLLRQEIPVMLHNMLNALLDKDIQEDIETALHIAVPIFMKAVPAHKWEKQFIKVLNSYKESIFEDVELDISKRQIFIENSVALIKDKNIKLQIIKNCLLQKEKIGHYCNSIIIHASKGIEVYDKETMLLLGHLLQIAKTSAHYFILLNMQNLINKKKLELKLLQQDLSFYNNIPLLYGASFFAKRRKHLQELLRKYILQSNLLWRTGINENGHSVSLGYTYLDINVIQRNIKFKDEEIIQIYHKMVTPLLDIDKYCRNANDSFVLVHSHWDDLLTYMHEFLQTNKKILKHEVNYATNYKKVEGLLNFYRDGKSLQGMLLDNYYVTDAITELVKRVSSKNLKKYYHEYLLLANIIITRSSRALNSCFIHFAWALEHYKDKWPQNRFASPIGSILEEYEKYFKKENASKWDILSAEKNIAESSLIKIAKVYEGWGYKSFFGRGYKRWYV